ncbi:MAG TPA: response regulator [Candidatus Andersenbacteria bacterium]|nr:response regulator [Candidatus Andersenbacteria bacterium]
MNTKKKILIIEDEKILGDILLNKLNTEGYEASWELNGISGLESMRSSKPDLVLLDIVMPEKDGYEVLEEVHKDQTLNTIPIIIISNSGQPIELKRILELGAKDYIVKADFSLDEILVKVRKYIHKEETSLDDSPNKKHAHVKILIIEDDTFIVSVVKKRLDKEGYDISTAKDGVQALEHLKNEVPDLILLDVVMPGINGFEVLKKIKADPRYDNMAVIIFSNLSQEHEIEEGKKLGADEFLVKSNFTPQEVIETINALLKKKGKI